MKISSETRQPIPWGESLCIHMLHICYSIYVLLYQYTINMLSISMLLDVVAGYDRDGVGDDRHTKRYTWDENTK